MISWNPLYTIKQQKFILQISENLWIVCTIWIWYKHPYMFVYLLCCTVYSSYIGASCDIYIFTCVTYYPYVLMHTLLLLGFLNQEVTNIYYFSCDNDDTINFRVFKVYISDYLPF